MDERTIYNKTAEGEEAIRERTRLVQRNLRTVLIIVDGRSDVAELKRKGGDAAMVESALAELEGMGLISAVGMSEESAAPRGEPGVWEVTLEPVGEPLEEIPAAPKPAPAPKAAAEPKPAPKPAPPPKPKERKPSPLALLVQRWRDSRQRRKAAKEDVAFEQTYYEELVEVPPPAAPSKAVPRRPPRPRRSVAKMLAGAALALIVALVLGLVFFPYGIYRADIERQASAALQDKVKIGKVDLTLLPSPAIALHQVEVGDKPYAEAAKVRLVPAVGSLFAERKIMRVIEVEGLRLEARGIAAAARWFPARATDRLIVRRLTLADMSMASGSVQIEKWSGEFEFADAGGLVDLVLRNGEGNGQLDLKPTEGGFAAHGNFSGWTAPFGDAQHFDSLEVAGVIDPHGWRLDKIDGTTLAGRVQGQGSLEWEKGLALNGDLSLKQVDLGQLLKAFGLPGLVSGPAEGSLRLSCKGTDYASLFAGASGDGRVTVNGGTINRLGLVEAIRGSGRGNTRFERLSAVLDLGPDGAKLDKLQVSSGAMSANGWLSAARDGHLDGRINVELRGAAGGRASLAVSGKADDPQLKK